MCPDAGSLRVSSCDVFLFAGVCRAAAVRRIPWMYVWLIGIIATVAGTPKMVWPKDPRGALMAAGASFQTLATLYFLVVPRPNDRRLLSSRVDGRRRTIRLPDRRRAGRILADRGHWSAG